MAVKKKKPVQPIDKNPAMSRKQMIMNELAQVAVDLQRINRLMIEEKPQLEARFAELDAELQRLNSN